MITPAEKHDRYDALSWQLTAAALTGPGSMVYSL